MDSLPLEISRRVFEFLQPSELLSLAQVCYEYYLAALSLLFSDLTFRIEPYTAELSTRSLQLILQLHADYDVRGAPLCRMTMVRDITVLPSSGPCFRVTPRAFRTLYATFYQLLQAGSITNRLQRFRWRIGCPEGLDRFPLSLGSHIRVLDCAACQVDPRVFFPSLKALTLRRVRAADGGWLTQQIRYCKLEHLSISGINSTETIRSACFSQNRLSQLSSLKSLELEYIHVDDWILPSTTKLEQLSLRSCTEGGGLYDLCVPNLTHLRSLELVSDYDVWGSNSFKHMLWSCSMLEKLILLVGGRTTNIPLSGLRPLRSSIQVLILEARLFSIAPALNYQYTVDDVQQLLAEMQNLRVLGVSVEPSGAICSHALLSNNCHLRVLHLRNWLTPEQARTIAKGLEDHLCAASEQNTDYDPLLILGDQCYKVTNSPHGAGLILEQSQSEPCQQHRVPWHLAL